MEKLPPPEVREWLLDCLRMLIRREGMAPLSRPPLSGPDALGPWTPDPQGLARLGRRLLDHAGLRSDVLRVRPARASRPTGVQPPGPLALTSYDDGVIRLELARSLPRDRALLAGTLAAEVARVWRARRGLEVVEADLEDQLTGLTGVYLGFGVLLARLPRERATATGTLAPPLLDPAAVAWLLAAQHLARGAGRWSAWALGWRLEPVTRRALWTALAELRALPDGIHERLRLPEPVHAPTPGRAEARELEALITGSDARRP